MPESPLKGYKIIDLSRYAPGRYCTMLLADFGAEVITVEAPRSDKYLPPILTDDNLPRYLALNRNKRSITVDLKKDKGREIILKLANSADVLVEGFRPGVTKKLGIDYETLKNTNPQLIYCSMSGFGQDGPYADRSGHDINYVGISGILGATGPEEGKPCMIGNVIADLIGGFCQTTIALLIALIEKKESGKGQYIDIAYLDGLIHSLWIPGTEYLLTGKLLKRGKEIITGLSAGYNIYETLDNKYLTLGCFEPWFWERLCSILGRKDFVEHQTAKKEKREEILAFFKRAFKSKTRDEWLKILEEADIPCGPVNDFSETFSDPQVIHRQMVSEVNHPDLGSIRQIGIPMKFSRTPGKIKTPPPRYGEHTIEVLKELNYTNAAIKELIDSKTIEQ